VAVNGATVFDPGGGEPIGPGASGVRRAGGDERRSCRRALHHHDTTADGGAEQVCDTPSHNRRPGRRFGEELARRARGNGYRGRRPSQICGGSAGSETGVPRTGLGPYEEPKIRGRTLSAMVGRHGEDSSDGRGEGSVSGMGRRARSDSVDGVPGRGSRAVPRGSRAEGASSLSRVGEDSIHFSSFPDEPCAAAEEPCVVRLVNRRKVALLRSSTARACVRNACAIR
jgi:hypothetical protein